eukprot:CAMPEP_0198236390 /NCGR_PEP_ID=MMETSP1446-20131203/2265_1 /TAXON_ID=1461542 ORGANISM="Unidentified sp, Strain CCMP2111" /NCGR_SAMPLE_ID=MMETSP1446 /ASSEMBLY_ACC=CAM_ASM_001112 /LENGTH=777 /DNA_ID=CAMNT_0043918101 /DNA_START=54 /DNA_END=2387 /DNA_ORIENTATION=+
MATTRTARRGMKPEAGTRAMAAYSVKLAALFALLFAAAGAEDAEAWYEVSRCSGNGQSTQELIPPVSPLVAASNVEVTAALSLSRPDRFNAITDVPVNSLGDGWTRLEGTRSATSNGAGTSTYGLGLALTCGEAAAILASASRDVVTSTPEVLEALLNRAAYLHWNYTRDSEKLTSMDFKPNPALQGLRFNLQPITGDGWGDSSTSLGGRVDMPFEASFDMVRSVVFVTQEYANDTMGMITASCCDLEPTYPAYSNAPTSASSYQGATTIWTTFTVDRTSLAISSTVPFSHPVQKHLGRPHQGFFFMDVQEGYQAVLLTKPGSDGTRLIYKATRDNSAPSLYFITGDGDKCFDTFGGPGGNTTSVINGVKDTNSFLNQMAYQCEGSYPVDELSPGLDYNVFCDQMETLNYIFDIFSNSVEVPFEDGKSSSREIRLNGDQSVVLKETTIELGDPVFTPLSYFSDSWQRPSKALLSYTFADLAVLSDALDQALTDITVFYDADVGKGSKNGFVDIVGTTTLMEFLMVNAKGDAFRGLTSNGGGDGPIKVSVEVSFATQGMYKVGHNTVMNEEKSKVYVNRPLSMFTVDLARNISIATQSGSFWSFDEQYTKLNFLSQNELTTVSSVEEANKRLFNPCYAEREDVTFDEEFSLFGVPVSASTLGGIFSFLAPATITGSITGCGCDGTQGSSTPKGDSTTSTTGSTSGSTAPSSSTYHLSDEIIKTKKVASGAVAVIVIVFIIAAGCAGYCCITRWLRRRKGFRWMKVNDDGVLEMTPARP